jgi:hypothetical protein
MHRCVTVHYKHTTEVPCVLLVMVDVLAVVSLKEAENATALQQQRSAVLS